MTLNGDSTPYNFTCNSHKNEIWWQCSKNPKHMWQATIKSRNEGNGCPYCRGLYASEDYNLLICNPKLCEEWDYERNNKRPEEHTPNSGQKAYWKCQECNHKWMAAICDRNIGKGCSKCSESYGEKSITNYLKSYNIYFESQKEFEGLIGLGNGNLSYDSFLPDYNLLIEYQGQFHDGSSGEYSKKNLIKQQEHDKRKKDYAKLNGYNFLEIWYWDFDNIESILQKELNINKNNNSENIVVFYNN